MGGFLYLAIKTMTTLSTLELMMVLLPIIFMLHDFEEIIMFRLWLRHNHNELQRRFPYFEAFLTRHHIFDYTTATFSIAIAHEFLLISLMCYLAIYLQMPHWWLMTFAGFFVHLLIHVAQWLIYGKYIPAIITTLLALPYCVYTLYEFINANLLTPSQLFLWAVIGIALMTFSVPLAFFWANIFHHRTHS